MGEGKDHPAFFGAGVVFAALTGVCVLAALLSLARVSWWAPVWAALAWACWEAHVSAVERD